MNRKAQTHKRTRKKRAVPVQPPKVPSFGSYVSPPEVPMMYQRMKQNAATDKKMLGGMIGGTWKGGASNELLLQEDEDVSSPRDNSPIFGVVPKMNAKEGEKYLMEQKREEQKKLKEEEKLEKRRAKEDAAKMKKLLDKEKELEKKNKRKSKQTKPNANENQSGPPAMLDFVQSDKNYIPLFLEKCIEFIELEGLDSEGIYRVPGNRAHVDQLYQKFDEG